MDVAVDNPVKAVHRASLLHELLVLLSSSSPHTSKKLLSITTTSDPDGALELAFEDSATTLVNASIGADGHFNTVRQHVLGADNLAAQPVAAG